MNSIIEDNKYLLKSILDNNSKLKDITLENDILIYKNVSININHLNLKLLLSNNYSKLSIDIKNDDIYPENFIEILKINSYSIEDDSKIDNNYSIINFTHFKDLLNRYNSLNEKEFKDLINFQKYMKLLMLQTTSDDTYLNEEQKNLLDNYLNLMQEMLQNNNHNKASDNYLKIVEDVNYEKTKRLKRYIALEQKDGFVNAIFMIVIFIITGLIIGWCGIFLIK